MAEIITNIVLDGLHAKITINRAITAGETGTIQYIPNALAAKQLQGLTGTKVAAFTESVTNNVPVSIPAIQSITIEDADPYTVIHTYDLALDETSTPVNSAFAISGKTVSSILVTGFTVKVTCTERFYWGDSATTAYTAPVTNMIKSTLGGEADSFTATAITNNIETSAQTDALIARFTTPPTDEVKAKVNKRIVRSIAAGYWDKLDVLVCLDIQDTQASTRNWKADAINATLVNTPVHTVGSGFTNGDGAARYINTNFIPSIDGSNYKLDDASFFVNTSGLILTGTTYQGHGVSTAASLLTLLSHSTLSGHRSNCITSFTTKILKNGLNAVARIISTTFKFYTDEETSRVASSTVLPAKAVYILEVNNKDTSVIFPVNSDCYAKNYGFGAHLTFAEMTDLNNILNDV